MLDKYIKGAGELRIMKSIIEDTRAVSPVVATLLLIVVVASASSFIAVMVSDFGRDTAEVDIEDVGDAAAIKIDVIGTDLAKLATDALKSRYEEANRGVRINVEGDDTDAGIIAVGMRLADIAAAVLKDMGRRRHCRYWRRRQTKRVYFLSSLMPATSLSSGIKL